jgi:hypothetical protein
MRMQKRLLILSCSRAKNSYGTLLPAIERYDGPMFRILRSYLRSTPRNYLEIWILSAEYGLISCDERIALYDRCMTQQRAQELRSSVAACLASKLASGHYAEVLICAGRNYVNAMGQFRESQGTNIRFAPGRLGYKLAALKSWLHTDGTDRRYTCTEASIPTESER